MNRSLHFDVSFHARNASENIPIKHGTIPRKVNMESSHLEEHKLGVAPANTPHKKEFHIHSINIEGNATHEEYN